MQHLGVNFGGIWRFELGFSLSGFFFFLCVRNLGSFLMSSGNAAAHSTAILRHVVYTSIVQCHYLSVLIHDRVMHPNTLVYNSCAQLCERF